MGDLSASFLIGGAVKKILKIEKTKGNTNQLPMYLYPLGKCMKNAMIIKWENCIWCAQMHTFYEKIYSCDLKMWIIYSEISSIT